MTGGDIIRRDRNGVLLRYADPGERRPHHVERKHHACDRERMRLIKAEHELITLWVMAEHLDLSDIALTRIADALQTIRAALRAKRRDYDMASEVAA